MKLWHLIIGLTLFGLVMVGNASVVSSSRDFGDQWHYLKLQTVWAAVGLAGFVGASIFPTKLLRRFALAFFGITLLLLCLVLVPGIGVSALGARRWLDLGFTSFQPSELAKLSLAIYLGVLFKSRPTFLRFIIPLSILALLVVAERDFGTTVIILGMGFLTYFGMGGRLLPFLIAMPVAAAVGAALIVTSPYRLARVTTFFNPSSDPEGSSYQVRQALIGVGSGGLFGVGLGQSRQKFNFLPEATTDSIFAIVAEELGLLGGGLLVLAFVYLISRGMYIAKKAVDPFNQAVALALTSWIGLQAFINLSALVALLPFTGVPLPFISYGGTSLVVTLIASGLLVNISRGV